MESRSGVSKRIDWLAVGLLLLSGLNLIGNLSSTALLVILGIAGWSGVTETLPLFSVAWITLLLAGISLPALVLSLMRLLGKSFPATWQISPRTRLLAPSAALLLWPLLLLAGNFLSGQNNGLRLLHPPLQLLVVLLPLWWLVEFVRYRLPDGSNGLRDWGVLNVTLSISVPIIVVVEILALGLGIGVYVGSALSNPEIERQLNQLAQRLVASAAQDPAAVQRALRPYLSRPDVLLVLIAVLSGLVPMVEEMFKPLALWFLGKRNLTPAQGLLLGALCGAAFTILESLGNLANPLLQDWAALVVGRTGTAVMHVTTSALVGWGLASALKNGKYLRLALAYLAAVTLHGVWNFFAILMGFGAFINPQAAYMSGVVVVSQIAPYALGILAALYVLLLYGLRRKQTAAG